MLFVPCVLNFVINKPCFFILFADDKKYSTPIAFRNERVRTDRQTLCRSSIGLIGKCWCVLVIELGKCKKKERKQSKVHLRIIKCNKTSDYLDQFPWNVSERESFPTVKQNKKWNIRGCPL